MSKTQKSDMTNVLISRETLFQEHSKTAESAGKLFSGRILPSEYGVYDKKVDRVVRNLQAEVRANVMTGVDQKIQDTINKRNAELKANHMPTLTPLQQQKIANRASASTAGKFKGATLDQRLKVSQRNANLRLKNELRSATSKANAELAKERAKAYLTNRRETGRSILGGSNFKYNERILVSEMARAEQNASKEFLKETGMFGRWVLSANHKKFDICDKIAEGTGAIAGEKMHKLNMDILPEGVYTLEEMPTYPHPYCQCQIEPVYMRYGINFEKNKTILENGGEMQIPYNQGMVSLESQRYYNAWMKQEYKNVLPYDAPKRTREEVTKKLLYIDKKTTAGIDGAVKLKNSPLEKYVKAGGTRGYEELAKNTLGFALDADTVDKLGVDGAIKLLARDLRKSGKADEIIEALQLFNEQRLPKIMNDSLRTSKVLMQEADALRLQVLAGTPKRTVQGMRVQALVKARVELGDAIGYAEAHERLLKELLSPTDIKFLNLNIPNKRAGDRLADLLGMDNLNYKIIQKGKLRFLSLGDEAMDKLSALYDKTGHKVMSKELDAIRRGSRNKAGWLPKGFKEKYPDKATGKLKQLVLTKDQQTGIRFAEKNKTALFNYKPGAGKTHTAMGTITDLASEGKIKKALIIVPDKTLASQFAGDFDTFTDVKGAKALTWQNPAQRRLVYDSDNLVTIITKTTLKSDAEYLSKAGYDIVVADEIHEYTDDMFKALKGIKSEYRIAMTGTPVKDSLSDMYNPLDWLSKSGVGGKFDFDNKFKDLTKASSVYQKSAMRDLRDTLKPYVLTKESPVKAKLVPVYRRVDLSKAQLDEVKKIETNALIKMDLGKMSKKEIEAERDKLLGKVVNAGDAQDNTKVKEVLKILDKNPKEKIIIFVADNDAMKTVQQGLGDRAKYYTGDLSDSQKRKLIAEFRHSADVKVLVLPPKGQTGLNLEVSNIAIHWDMPAKNYILEQRTARNWRGIKTETTYQYMLQSNTTFDSRIRKSLEKSKAASEGIKIAELLDDQGVAKVLQNLLRRK